MISAFLNHLETERHNSIRTRNVRLTAIRFLFSYAALRHPEHALLIQRVLAIPPKRFDPLTWRGAKGTRTPNRLLAKSPNGLRERAIEHVVGRSGVPDHAGFVTDCSTSVGYECGQRQASAG